MYSKKVMKHFQKPHNMGEIKNADGVGKVGNPQCGDLLWVFLKVAKNREGKEIIKDIKFKTFGCVAAISTASALSDLAKGKTLEEALAITKEDIAKALDGLPKPKMHCSLLAANALKKAIEDYNSRK